MSKKLKAIERVSKEELIKELQDLSAKYLEVNPKATHSIPRRWYRKNTKYPNMYETRWGSYSTPFEAFKKEAGVLFIERPISMNAEESIETDFSEEKKLMSLKEQNRQLKSDRDRLLLKSIDEETIMKMFSEKRIDIKLPKPLKLKKPSKGIPKQSAILVLSDFHCGELIRFEDVNGINEFNVDIMKERLDRVFYYFVYFCEKFNIKTAHLLWLGDLFSGFIHDELIRSAEYHVVECLFILQKYITEKLLEIESHFDKITNEFLVGNHSRIMQGKPYFKDATQLNWEHVLARELKIQFEILQPKNPKIIINIADAIYKVVEVEGRKFLISHGHHMTTSSNSFAGISYYSLAMSSAKMSGVFSHINQPFSDCVIGHLHTPARVKTTTGNLYVNGSIVGTGEYGLMKMKVIADPEQLMLVVRDGIVINEISLKANKVY